ncbi:uncharacterized protein EAF02_011193 [Botrytis sinoallii]|uniref:uncharacterized protein n=1 Tax=Botrytis sinoallii TaxID=1463999 RepID=UPI0018FFE1F4|nr:uncharacterized protein EAF02_011193 [Botrytis sinoallii]KAF7857826.1 hypothetical protein EAF02_011193 [Botrytis sinoallii]
MSRTLPVQNLPIGADESSAPLQQDQETIPRSVGYRPENQCEYNNAEKFTRDSKFREDPLFLNILSEMDDVQIAGQKREILNGHGESENFTKYEYDMNEDINNGDTSLNGYAVNASLPSPRECIETKKGVDLRIQSAIDTITYYTESPTFATQSASDANVDESY